MIPTSLLSCLDWLLLSMLSTMPQSPTNTWTMQSAAPAKSAESYKAEFRHIENTSINVTSLNLLYVLIYRLKKRVQTGTLLHCTGREPSQAIKLNTTLTPQWHHAPLAPLFKHEAWQQTRKMLWDRLHQGRLGNVSNFYRFHRHIRQTNNCIWKRLVGFKQIISKISWLQMLFNSSIVAIQFLLQTVMLQ